jgi:hypothetical protein
MLAFLTADGELSTPHKLSNKMVIALGGHATVRQIHQHQVKWVNKINLNM